MQADLVMGNAQGVNGDKISPRIVKLQKFYLFQLYYTFLLYRFPPVAPFLELLNLPSVVAPASR